MDLQKYVADKKLLQSSLLKFLDQTGTEEEENYQNLVNLIKAQKISEDKDELRAFFHLISQISANHHRTLDFHCKIDRVMSIFENDIKESFLNLELFHIFKRNKRILLYLIQNNLIFLDQNIAKVLAKPKYRKLRYIHYFYPELKKFLTDEHLREEIEKDICKYNFDTYQRLRQQGENEQKVCELIRNDSIDDFISFVTQEKSSFIQPISTSIFETNTFLIKNNSTLIEYSAFFGSIQIFKYLLTNNSKITPELWLYAIHGQNFEIINTLETRPLRPKDHSYIQVLDECFKCHNGEVTKYIIEKLVKIKKDEEVSVLAQSAKYYDYAYFPNDLNNQFIFVYLCHADNFSLLNELVNLSKKNFKLNAPILSKAEKRKESALNIAVMRENYDIISFLLNRPGINVNSITIEKTGQDKKTEKNTLFLAIENGSTEIVKLLLKQPTIDVNSESFDKKKKTPLHIAAEKGNQEIFNLLLKHPEIKLNDCVFLGCNFLKEIVIPSTITTIGKFAFSGCTSLKNIVISKSIKTIEMYAFKGCTSLETITIPSSVESIGGYAFEECTSLQQIMIHASITSIEPYLFSKCTALKEVKIPATVSSIGKYAFNSCSSISKIILPSSLKSIGTYAFTACTSLRQITIPNSVKSVGYYAFVDASELRQLILPKQLEINMLGVDPRAEVIRS